MILSDFQNKKLFFLSSFLVFIWFAFSFNLAPFLLIYIFSGVKIIDPKTCKGCKGSPSCKKDLEGSKCFKAHLPTVIYISFFILPMLDIKAENSYILMWLFLISWSINFLFKIIKKREVDDSNKGVLLTIIIGSLIGLLFAHISDLYVVFYTTPIVCILCEISYLLERKIKNKFKIGETGFMEGFISFVDRFDGLFLPLYFIFFYLSTK
jgi:hypothetical protein